MKKRKKIIVHKEEKTSKIPVLQDNLPDDFKYEKTISIKSNDTVLNLPRKK